MAGLGGHGQQKRAHPSLEARGFCKNTCLHQQGGDGALGAPFRAAGGTFVPGQRGSCGLFSMQPRTRIRMVLEVDPAAVAPESLSCETVSHERLERVASWTELEEVSFEAAVASIVQVKGWPLATLLKKGCGLLLPE